MKTTSKVETSWDKFLNPETLKQNLLQGGLFLVAFEMLKDSLVGGLKDFFCFEGIADGEVINDFNSPEYIKEVCSLDKHPFTAHALWWYKQGALSDDDLDTLRRIREHRDQIAHNMPKMIMTADHNIDLELLSQANTLLAKLDNWWLKNVEAGIDPERFKQFAQEEIDNARSSRSIFLSMMLPLVSGDDSQFQTIYKMWCASHHQKD